jgi:hypothetical protein
MQYSNLQQGSIHPYPSHSIDPQKKDKKWGIQYARAAWHDWSFTYPKGIFANNNGDYEKFKMYALGKQPNTPYKKMLGVDNVTDNTWLSVDWSIRSIVSPYRDKAISRLMDNEFGIVATPIDITAKSDLDAYYVEMKTKLMIRDLMMQQNPELANHPMISIGKGEPMDVEELEMRVEQGEQFNRSKDAELAIAVGMHENNYQQARREFYEDLFDNGVTGYKEWLGDDNKAKFRKCVGDNVVINFCKKADFSDLIHAGEMIDVPLVELATLYEDGEKVFTEEELTEFAASLAGRWDNPKMLGSGGNLMRPYDKFKCKVLDFEFYSYNDHVYRDAPDENGNPDFRKAEYGRGKKSDKYKRKCFQVVYKIKWVIGTDKAYGFGLAHDMKRYVDPKKKAKTSLSYKFMAYNFYEMRAQGFMERLIPYLDDYQLTMLKIQNFKNRAVPSGWWIDMDGLERTALNKGGKNMTPMELLQMFFETGVLVGRSQNADGSPAYTNVQPIIPISNTAATELQMFFTDLVSTIQAIERLTGYNDVTSGEANPKTLVPGYEIADMSTNHALYPMKFAEKMLTEHLAYDVLTRMQQGVRKGGIAGYAQSLNSNMLRFIEISPDIAFREYGIMLEERTSDEQKQWLYQMMQQDIANGWLDASDAVYLVNTHNAKQVQMIWAHRVKKGKELAHQRQAELVQQQTEGNAQAGIAIEQAKQQTMALELQGKLQEKQLIGEIELAKEKMRIDAEERLKMREMELKYTMNVQDNATKLQVAETAADSKIDSQVVASLGDLDKTGLAGDLAIEKQKEANKKPVSKPSSKK